MNRRAALVRRPANLLMEMKLKRYFIDRVKSVSHRVPC